MHACMGARPWGQGNRPSTYTVRGLTRVHCMQLLLEQLVSAFHPSIDHACLSLSMVPSPADSIPSDPMGGPVRHGGMQRGADGARRRSSARRCMVATHALADRRIGGGGPAGHYRLLVVSTVTLFPLRAVNARGRVTCVCVGSPRSSARLHTPARRCGRPGGAYVPRVVRTLAWRARH
jgi:hypothetical protein